MRNRLARFHGWKRKRQEKFLERWRLERLRGEGRYIRRTALTWASSMTMVVAMCDDFYGRFELFPTLFKFGFYLIGGFFVGWQTWRSNERTYLQHLQKNSQPMFVDRDLPTSIT